MSNETVQPGDLFMYRDATLYVVTEPYGKYGGSMRGWVLRPLSDPADWCWDEERNLVGNRRFPKLWRKVA